MAICFGDAVHLSHLANPACDWLHKENRPVFPANSGRNRLNIHAALSLETFETAFVDAEIINGDKHYCTFKKLHMHNPDKRVIHLIIDNAPYHESAKLQEWLSRPDCRIKVHLLSTYPPHLNTIERLWGGV